MGVQGVERELVISEVPAECPGLVGSSELSAWQMKLDFEATTFPSAGRTAPIIYARSGHPCMSLLEYKRECSTTVYQLDVAEDSDEDMPPLVETSDEDRGSLVDDADKGLEALLENTRAKTEYYDIAGTMRKNTKTVSRLKNRYTHGRWNLRLRQKRPMRTSKSLECSWHRTKTRKECRAWQDGAWRHVRSSVKRHTGMYEQGKETRKEEII